MNVSRPAAVAGTFYPHDALTLSRSIRELLANSRADGTAPKALIAPHAGYIYSGAIAASAYARVSLSAAAITRVVLLGPSHRIGFSGLAQTSARQFLTPLGAVEIDRDAYHHISALPQMRICDPAHELEHSLEVHIPFLQETLGDFRLVPLVVGDATAVQVSEVLERLWGGPETLIVVSSDLSHYHDYATAQAIDRRTSTAIERFEVKKISARHACGHNPIIGLLQAARHHELRATTLDLRNSGDTAGSRDRVVGYGAYCFN